MDEEDQEYYYYNCNDSLQNEGYSMSLSSGFNPSNYQKGGSYRLKKTNAPQYFYGH